MDDEIEVETEAEESNDYAEEPTEFEESESVDYDETDDGCESNSNIDWWGEKFAW